MATTSAPGGILHARIAGERWGTMEWLADDAIRPQTGLSLARMTVHAGNASPAHSHPDCSEVIHVLRGTIEQRVGGDVLRLGPGATCLVPPGAIHATTAIGPDDAVMIVAYSAGARIYQPA